MSTTVDESGRLLDPEAEVRKLQDLVAKLTEERNLYLRNKGNVKESHIFQNQNTDFQEVEQQNAKGKSYDRLKDGLSNVSLDDVELLDVTSLENLEEEDSWLYSSPRKLSPSQQNISPYKWIREEFERPELESARRSLLFKLDELSRCSVSRSASSGTLGSPVSPVGNPPAPFKGGMPHINSTGSMPHIRQPLFGLGSRVDTSTFTRPKKRSTANDNRNQAPQTDSSKYSQGCDTVERNNNADYSYRTDENANGHSGASSGSQESLGTSHRLADVMDVQVVARMQEESLRQSLNTPRKSFSEDNPDSDKCDSPTALSQSLNRSLGGLLDGIDSGSLAGSNRSSPSRLDSDMYQSTKRSNNSLASFSSNSTSSPPTSPYSSQYLDQKTQAMFSSDGHRSSLPNLTRGPTNAAKLPSNSSDPRLRERSTPSPSSSRSQYQSSPRGQHGPSSTPVRQLRTPVSRPGGSPSRTLSPSGRPSPQRTLSPQRGYSPQRSNLSPQRALSPQRTASPQRNMSPGRTLSPQRSGIPSPGKSSIPRPGANTKLPTPRRSSIPSMRRSLATPRVADESWKDGCY